MSCCTSVAILSSILAYLCSLLGCVGVVLQTYSVGSCGLLCKSGPHAVIRWFNIFLTKERVSRGRRRHNGWLFEVLVQGIHLPSNPFLLLQIFNCNYPQRSWIVAKINIRTCARHYLICHSFATGVLWFSTIILTNCKFGDCIGNSPIRQIKALAKVSTYTVTGGLPSQITLVTCTHMWTYNQLRCMCVKCGLGLCADWRAVGWRWICTATCIDTVVTTVTVHLESQS